MTDKTRPSEENGNGNNPSTAPTDRPLSPGITCSHVLPIVVLDSWTLRSLYRLQTIDVLTLFHQKTSDAIMGLNEKYAVVIHRLSLPAMAILIVSGLCIPSFTSPW